VVSTHSQELAPGTVVDRYEIDGLLGSGGFGAVYSARHTFLGQRVALKLLHREHVESHDAVERFFREARAAAAVGSPHIIQVHDCGLTADQVPFLAMELLEGRDLAGLLGKGKGETPSHERFDLDRSASITLQVLDGLAAAHGAGIVHRDLKPANIFLVGAPGSDEDFVKLLDFGVSKVQLGALETALTQTGMWLGTPMYMAPEQFKDSRVVDRRADLYSAAVILYQMLADRLPHDAETPIEAAYRATMEPPPPLESIAPHVPIAVCRVVERGLAKDPEARWSDALSFSMALRSSLSGTGATQPSLGVTAGPAVTQPESGASFGVAAIRTATDSQGHTNQNPVAPEMASPTSASASGYGQTGVGAPEPRRFGLWAALIVTAALLGGAVAVIIFMLLDVGGDDENVPRPVVTTPPVVQSNVPIPTMPAPPYGSHEPAPPANPYPQAPATPTWPGASGIPPMSPTPVVTPQPVPATPGRPWNGEIISNPDHTPQPTPPAPVAGSSPIEFGEPRIVGDLDANAIYQVFALAQPGMERCRRGVANQVQVQAHIHSSPGRVTLVRPSASNTGPEDVARCCGNVFRSSVPSGWNPGNSGIIFFDVMLQAR